jgi:hypothetical protein
MAGSHVSLAAIACILGALAKPAAAQSTVPDTVAVPKALNLGTTSFFDGFGNISGGWTLLQYVRTEDIDRITDAQGRNSPYFKGTSIQVFAGLTQISYASPWHPFGGDAVGFSGLLPVISLNAHFAADSPVRLPSNGIGVGDFVWGPSYQSKTYTHDGRALFSWRTQILVMSPTGAFNKSANLNQGVAYWGIDPYVAATFLPTRKLEFSSRLNYQYNFESVHIANPPRIPGLAYLSGQAGELVYGNFDASYAVTDELRFGMNGYFLDQLTPDRTNGAIVPRSRESEIYLGPGARAVFDKADALNVNLYLPVESRNGSPGLQLNLQYTHRFQW